MAGGRVRDPPGETAEQRIVLPQAYGLGANSFAKSRRFLSLFFSFLFFINLFILFTHLFIFGCVGSSLLHPGFSLVAASGLLLAVASLVAEHGL